MVLNRASNRRRWQFKLNFLDKKYAEIDKNGMTDKARFYDKCVNKYSYVLALLWDCMIFVILYIGLLVLFAFFIYVINIIFSVDPTSLSNVIVCIASLIGIIGTFINGSKQDIDVIKVDSALFVMRYLVELSRGNKDCKILKGELSLMLLSWPDKLLKLLYRVQKNIDDDEEDAKEIIIFLIEYLRNNMKLGGETLEAKDSTFAYDFIRCSSVNISDEE